MKKVIKVALFALAASTFVVLAINAYSIRPLSWIPPAQTAFTGATTLNDKLTSTKKISLRGWFGPEDIEFDSLGNMYTGVHTKEADFTDGVILKIDTNGRQEIFYNARSWVAGLHFDANGNLIALSHKQGLISISPDKKVTILARKDDTNAPFLIPNGLDISSDGKIFFSNTSQHSAYNIRYGKKIILEMKPIGGLYCYDPVTRNTKTLIRGTYFGNGVVVSKDENYVLLVETAKYRILRYWLRGSKAGQTDIFIDNLPGFPNGISIREDGSYWLGFSTKRSKSLDDIHSNPAMKRLVYALPEFLQPKAERFGMVMNLSPDGKILRSFMDTLGTVLPEAGAVKEFRGHLYLGGDVLPHVGKYKLIDTSATDNDSRGIPNKITQLTDSSYRALKREFGPKKELPRGYEEQALLALSHFPELKETKIKWRIKKAYTPISTRPQYSSVLKRKHKRTYVITISNKTVDTLKPLMFDKLSFDQQVGIMGHELSHVLDFKNKNLVQSLRNLIGHVSAKYMDVMEFNTDMICIQHGLGRQLHAYSTHVRKSMKVNNWRGVDHLNSVRQKYERYMNPETIEAFVKLSSIN